MTLTAQAALFKSEVVKMLTNGQAAAYISKALDTSEKQIYRWKNQNQGLKKAASQQSELALENQDFIRQLFLVSSPLNSAYMSLFFYLPVVTY